MCFQSNHYELKEEYDYVLIDEAQDLPSSFFQVIYKLTRKPKRIIFAYDELQSLDNIETVDVEELFGRDAEGNYLVDFSNGSYGNGIEMDYMLRKSYRNPLEVLMLAHGIGLVIHNPSGYMQVIEDKKIWKSIGYEIIEGDCKAGDHMIIKRPVENSVSVARDFYSGSIGAVRTCKADSLEQKADVVVRDINKMIKEENVQYSLSLQDDSFLQFYFEGKKNGKKFQINKGSMSYLPNPDSYSEYFRFDIDLDNEKDYSHPTYHAHFGYRAKEVRFTLYKYPMPAEFLKLIQFLHYGISVESFSSEKFWEDLSDRKIKYNHCLDFK